MGFWRTALLGVSLFVAVPCAAEAPVDLLFTTGHLEEVAAGSTLTYRIEAIRQTASGSPEADDGTISLSEFALSDTQRRTVTATLTRGGRDRQIDPFSGVAANPVMLIFLEQVVRDIAQQTGGSPFYLRNRFRDALRDGLVETAHEGPGTRIAMQPLAQDPNRAKLGPLADLDVSFTLDPATPGMFRALVARAGPAETPVFLEEVTYVPQN